MQCALAHRLGRLLHIKSCGLTVTGEEGMNIALWVLAGGWIGYMHFKANEDERGRLTSILIGTAGAFCGGTVLAPMLGAVTDMANYFTLFSLAVALASASACVAVENVPCKRIGV